MSALGHVIRKAHDNMRAEKGNQRSKIPTASSGASGKFVEQLE